MTCNCADTGCENRVYVDGSDVGIISPQNPMWVTLPSGDHLPTRERRVTLTAVEMRELAADLLRAAEQQEG